MNQKSAERDHKNRYRNLDNYDDGVGLCAFTNSVDQKRGHSRYDKQCGKVQRNRLSRDHGKCRRRISCESIAALVKAFGEILDRAKNRPIYEVTDDDVSVPDMILHLTSLMRRSGAHETLPILSLLERQRSVRAMISMFLAVLELVRRQAVVLVQTEAFGEIALRKRPNFEEALAGQDNTQVEKDYK